MRTPSRRSAADLTAYRSRSNSPPFARGSWLQRRSCADSISVSTILTHGAADAPARQRTLRATIAWSYDLLEPADRALLARVGIFAGGFDLAAARAIVASPVSAVEDDLLGSLGRLVDQSVLRVTSTPDGEPRFSLLESIRQFALEQLDSDETQDLETATRRILHGRGRGGRCRAWRFRAAAATGTGCRRRARRSGLARSASGATSTTSGLPSNGRASAQTPHCWPDSPSRSRRSSRTSGITAKEARGCVPRRSVPTRSNRDHEPTCSSISPTTRSGTAATVLGSATAMPSAWRSASRSGMTSERLLR